MFDRVLNVSLNATFNSPNFMELSLPSNNYIYISFGRFSGFVTED